MKRTLLLLLFSLLVSLAHYTAWGQNKKLDSLWNVYNTKSLPDTTRLKAIDAIAVNYIINNKPDSAIIIAEQDIELAHVTKQKKFEANAFLIIGASYLNKNNYTKAIKAQRKAAQLFEEINNKKGVGIAYNKI